MHQKLDDELKICKLEFHLRCQKTWSQEIFEVCVISSINGSQKLLDIRTKLLKN